MAGFCNTPTGKHATDILALHRYLYLQDGAGRHGRGTLERSTSLVK